MAKVSIFLAFLLGAVCVSCANNSAANEFSKKFASLVKTDSNASKLLQIANVPEKKAGEVYKKVVTAYFQMLGTKDAAKVGEEIGDAVSRNLHKVSPSLFANLFGQNLASALQTKGLLTQDNADDLASKAAKLVSNAAKNNDVSSTEGKLKAILDSYKEFYNQVGIDFGKVADTIGDNLAQIADNA